MRVLLLKQLFSARPDNDKAAMRIKGPTNGTTPVDGVDEAAPVDGVDEVGASESTAPTAPVQPTAPAQGPGAIDAVTQVAAELRAGRITVDQAVERLIDDAISRQLGHQAAKDVRDLEPKLRELLRSYTENDPFLASRIRRLTLAK